MAGHNVVFGQVENFDREQVVKKPVKHYVLVSGLDYHDIWSFNSYALDEKKRIDGLANDLEIQIIYVIDILPGTITKIEKDEGAVTETVTQYDEITKSNYPSHHTFDDLGKTNYITKNTIYDVVLEIGTTHPKSLMEMHIFSHAYWNGPILANTYSTGAVDIDMRIDDTTSVSSNFTIAMNSIGYLKIWGCSFPIAANALFSRIRRNSNYSSSLIEDDIVFSYPPDHFNFVTSSGESLDLVGILNDRLGKSFNVTSKIDLTFKEIKLLAAKEFNGVYAAFLAYRAGINVYAALPATYAEITPSFVISSNTMQNVNFYKNHLNVTVDAGDYGLYDKKTIQGFIDMNP